MENPTLETMSNTELFLLFQKKNTEDIKHLIQIEKQLCKQNYDQKKLEEAKDKIINSLENKTLEFTRAEKEVAKRKKEMKWSVYYTLGILVISAMIYQQNLKGMSLERQPPIYLYFGLSVIIIFYLIFKTIAFKKSIKVLKLLDFSKKAELDKKLTILYKAWNY